MRKLNAVISGLILALFLVHGIAGGFQLMGWIPGGSRILKVLARAMVTLICVHSVIGIKLTADTLRLQRKSGAAYGRENRLFWIRRISGFAVFWFIFLHMAVFLGKDGGMVRLSYFGTVELVSHLLLAAALLVHLITNIRPLLIAFGIAGGRNYLKDILFVLSVVLLFTAAAFVVYYLRWNVLWRVG